MGRKVRVDAAVPPPAGGVLPLPLPFASSTPGTNDNVPILKFELHDHAWKLNVKYIFTQRFGCRHFFLRDSATSISILTQKENEVPDSQDGQEDDDGVADVTHVGEDEDGVEGADAEEDEFEDDDLEAGVCLHAGVGGPEGQHLGGQDQKGAWHWSIIELFVRGAVWNLPISASGQSDVSSAMSLHPTRLPRHKS